MNLYISLRGYEAKSAQVIEFVQVKRINPLKLYLYIYIYIYIYINIYTHTLIYIYIYI